MGSKQQIIPTTFAMALAAALQGITAGTAQAGPCSRQIAQAQSRVDAALGQTAARSRFGRESTAARLHHEPTPGSIARAEDRLDQDKAAIQMIAALKQARRADARGNRQGCRRALRQVQALLAGQ